MQSQKTQTILKSFSSVKRKSFFSSRLKRAKVVKLSLPTANSRQPTV